MQQIISLEEGPQNAELMSFKIIRAEYIESTIATGLIYFGCADYYAYQESTGNKGQGDKNEGLYARVLKSNTLYIQEQESIHGMDLIKIKNGRFIDLKLKSVINMPIYCFYSINASDSIVQCFHEPGETPRVRYWTYKFIVSKQIFQDFSSENFGMMNFINHTDLCSRINKSLKAENCKYIEKARRINYVNRANTEWQCPENHPAELFYKDDFFSYQREARIIVLDNEFSFIDEKDVSKKYKAVNIGNLEEIVKNEKIKIQDIRIEIPRVRVEEVLS